MFREGQRSDFPIRSIKHLLLPPKHNLLKNILRGKLCLLLEGRNANIVFQAVILRWKLPFWLVSSFPKGMPAFSHWNCWLPFKWCLVQKKINFSLGRVTGSISKAIKHFWDSGRKCCVCPWVPMPPLLHKPLVSLYIKERCKGEQVCWGKTHASSDGATHE